MLKTLKMALFVVRTEKLQEGNTTGCPGVRTKRNRRGVMYGIFGMTLQW